MRILVVGKCDYSHIVESTASAFRDCSHPSVVFDTRKYRRVDKYIRADYSRNRLHHDLEDWNPGLVLLIAPLFIDPGYVDIIDHHKRKHGGRIAGWVGDVFEETHERIRNLGVCDKVYVTDSHLLGALPGKDSAYLPLATDTGIFRRTMEDRRYEFSFIASLTANRLDLVKALDLHVDLWGPGWKKVRKEIGGSTVHGDARSIHQAARIYNRSRAVLNVKNAKNVVAGLNQRSFDPCACGCLLFHDHVRDLERHFDPGTDLIVYRDAEELEYFYRKYSRDRREAGRISESGWKKVVRHHTFRHRVEQILRDFDIGRRPS
ncbi:MAG: glycosyltransferase family 1 protein [Deltaproteobacteria bacterium]|nr:glycosyltransferase family 1 protein [Deltaproteobacteria bacterium]